MELSHHAWSLWELGDATSFLSCDVVWLALHYILLHNLHASRTAVHFDKDFEHFVRLFPEYLVTLHTNHIALKIYHLFLSTFTNTFHMNNSKKKRNVEAVHYIAMFYAKLFWHSCTNGQVDPWFWTLAFIRFYGFFLCICVVLD